MDGWIDEAIALDWIWNYPFHIPRYPLADALI